MKAIVLAGGRGVRLHPYTKVFPKPLIPLHDMPILQIILLQLRRAGVTEVCLALYYKAEQIERYFGDGSWLGMHITYSRSAEPLGTAGPLSLVEMFDEPCLVMNADLLTSIDFADVYAAHQQSGASATVVLCNHSVDVGFGVVNVDQTHQITGYVEKPQLSFLINGGIYVLDPAVLAYIPKGGYMDMSALLQCLLHEQRPVHGYVFTGDWFDIGTIEQYERAEEMFRTHHHRYLGHQIDLADLGDDEWSMQTLCLNDMLQLAQDSGQLTLLWR